MTFVCSTIFLKTGVHIFDLDTRPMFRKSRSQPPTWPLALCTHMHVADFEKFGDPTLRMMRAETITTKYFSNQGEVKVSSSKLIACATSLVCRSTLPLCSHILCPCSCHGVEYWWKLHCGSWMKTRYRRQMSSAPQKAM